MARPRTGARRPVGARKRKDKDDFFAEAEEVATFAGEADVSAADADVSEDEAVVEEETAAQKRLRLGEQRRGG